MPDFFLFGKKLVQLNKRPKSLAKGSAVNCHMNSRLNLRKLICHEEESRSFDQNQTAKKKGPKNMTI